MAKLYIVGTPIGNLEDITIRALQVLKEVEYIACEDTRVTRRLLSSFDIKHKKLLIHNEKNEKNSAKGIVKMIIEGNSVAQVSDAGMPNINDPGYFVLQEALKQNVQIEVVPGVSAVIMAVVLSNFNSHFTFHGFFKYKRQQRIKQLKLLSKGTHVFFASPHRIEKELSDIKVVFNNQIRVFVGRELTKKFESHYRGTIDQVIAKLGNQQRGEFTIVLEIVKGVAYDI